MRRLRIVFFVRCASLSVRLVSEKEAQALNLKPIVAALVIGTAVIGADAAMAQADMEGLRVEHANARNKAVTVRAPEFPTRSGPTALAFQVSPGQCAGNANFDDCGNGRERSEVIDRSSIATGQEYWYAFSVLIPNGVPALDPANTILAQWQDTRGSGEITLGLNYYQTGLELTQDDPRTSQSSAGSPPRPLAIKTVVPRGTTRGRWHDVKVQAVWSAQANGLIRVWIGDRLVHSHQGANLNRDVAPSFKFGLYRSGLQRLSGDAPRQIVLFDNVRVGRSEAAVTVN